jgi:hypothetical protein
MKPSGATSDAEWFSDIKAVETGLKMEKRRN